MEVTGISTFGIDPYVISVRVMAYFLLFHMCAASFYEGNGG